MSSATCRKWRRRSRPAACRRRGPVPAAQTDRDGSVRITPARRSTRRGQPPAASARSPVGERVPASHARAALGATPVARAMSVSVRWPSSCGRTASTEVRQPCAILSVARSKRQQRTGGKRMSVCGVSACGVGSTMADAVRRCTSTKEGSMPHFLIEVAYNAAGSWGLVKEPQDRIERVRPRSRCCEGDRVRRTTPSGSTTSSRRARCQTTPRLRPWCSWLAPREFVLHHHGPAHAGGGDAGDERRIRVGVPACVRLKDSCSSGSSLRPAARVLAELVEHAPRPRLRGPAWKPRIRPPGRIGGRRAVSLSQSR